MDKGKLALVSPWVNFYREIEALFGQDKDIKIQFNNDEKYIKLFVNGQDKYEALTKLLPAEKKFGNVTISIQVIPANNSEQSTIDLFRKAFNGNPIVTDIITITRDELDSTNDFNYVVFKKEVVQYHDDSLDDPHGNHSTLYQFIAEEVFDNHGGVYFCTDRNE